MPDGVLDALIAFTQEHRRCGELEGGLDAGRVWLACSCGAYVRHSVEPPAPPLTSSGLDMPPR
jgi:hypothetical protein